MASGVTIDTRTSATGARRRRWSAAVALGAGCLMPSGAGHAQSAHPAQSADTLSSAAWLSRLPDGAEKRRFILDCTGCHQFDARIAMPGDTGRGEQGWREAVERMLRYAGATTPFPVISAAREPAPTARWLTAALRAGNAPVRGEPARPPARGRAQITEFPMPEPRDLAHDVAVDGEGRVIVTGMFTDRMYVLDPARGGAMAEVPIPVERANPRAVELDAAGDWWVVLGAPNKLARYRRASREWSLYDIGMYAHSVAVGADGAAWVNGHFTRAPELVRRVTADSVVRTHELPPHPTLAAQPGGPVPYEIRTAPDGRVWMSELHGNRIVSLNPATGKSRAYDMPTPHSGPRRFDVDGRGVLWIPAYAANALVRFDPRTERFEEIPLPVRDAAPYVARVDARTGRVWIGTGAADMVLGFDPATRRFTAYPLPSRGAMVRHLAIDRRTGDVWAAYGASPGIPARIARIRPS
jgi:streptogramin lyase